MAVDIGRNIPLADYYPGDAFVDIIGIDTYDALPGNPTYASPGARWTALYAQPSGLGQVMTFAQAHGKPLRVPEWGLVNTAQAVGRGRSRLRGRHRSRGTGECGALPVDLPEHDRCHHAHDAGSTVACPISGRFRWRHRLTYC